MAGITIDIDTGGTFTDGFVVRDGIAHTIKTLTTPHDLAVCFRETMANAAQALGMTVPDMLRETVSVRYATTVGTNTVVQRRGPRIGLLTDAELPAADKDPGVRMFVEPAMVAELPASNGAAGAPALPALRGLLQDGARGLVVACSDDAAEDESAVADTFAEHYPKHCLDSVPLLRAGEVAADPDAARRRSTALFNAYLHPDVADFLYRAEDYLRAQGYQRPLRIVHNDGGAARVARTIAGKTYNSGPMAGLLGAQTVARHYGFGDLVTLDMGGTSLDVGILRAGEVPMRERGRVEDVEISFPLPDLVPLGVGGGSIAWLDGSELRVGPRSAGALPGPACFGFGGTEPTITDADVIAGVLRPESFLDGSMRIDRKAAERAFEPLAKELGLSVPDAAERVLAVVHKEAGSRLAEELRQRGIDPASVAALGFGGNGATHGVAIAAAAGIQELVVLPFAPVFSAYGASTVDIRHRHESVAGELSTQTLTTRVLRDMRSEGIPEQDVEVAVSQFERDGVAWERVEASYQLPHVGLAQPGTDSAAASAGSAQQPVRWAGHGELATTVLDGAALRGGDSLAGPALVDSSATTCAVPPGWTVARDENGALRLTSLARSN
ncbi:N-methylhydantoinase A/oxoprolinase/acetone carboxylase beta subunit [Tamaricihabitans halophyticus]|uniref:N-methylhydantoinase A/oxoprolinase/acetone carboxylase beta subunit n=1 Tax=Tamaricihabitans halophyticus TaxID=1262583 RepID=A0A4V2SU29_9PSEU|nr:hydantoinase/oxoprolinase family protein [Tamaricihabitans halophyticus]TCP52996.1 N-methylhydantoinase A/oxoprolinase/acetone carboxylase beta subunit [Tamaricihabitans halophyticus]